jgi:hypothetical protein
MRVADDALRGTLSLARALSPRILFDENEPFFPRWIGVTRLDEAGPSPSFRRELSPPPGGCVLEYAVYWDWDIQHLYDLEHIWLYLGSGGELLDAEASFHGKYLRSVLRDRSNVVGGRLQLYSQPGKHAFAPSPEIFRLLPDCESATLSKAGAAGAEVPWPLRDRITHDPRWDEGVRRYLASRAFESAWSFRPWDMDASIIVSWEELDGRLPALFREGLSAAGAL